jgi:hypothetical protein
MHSANFYIVKINGREVIRDHKTLLQIKIHTKDEGQFIPNDNEILLYGVGENKSIAFETVNIHAYHAELVAYALAWYVDFTDQPEMFITREDPKMPRRLKRA